MISFNKNDKKVKSSIEMTGVYTEKLQWEDELELKAHLFTAFIEEVNGVVEKTSIQWKDFSPLDRKEAETKIKRLLELNK